LNTNTPQDFHKAIFTIFYVEIIILILIFFFLKDSPRNLLINNKKEEAGEILEYYVNRKLTKEELDAIYDNLINSGENAKTSKKTDYKLLFSKRYIKFTINMMSVFFFFCFSIYGMNISIPIIIDHFYKSSLNLEKNKHHRTPIDSIILLHLISIPLFAAIFSEAKFIGKKYSNIILVTFTFVIGLFSFFMQYYFNPLIFFSLAFLQNAYYLTFTWANETSPTKIRDISLGLFVLSKKIGGFVPQFIFIALTKSNFIVTIVVYLVSIFIIIVCLIILPKNEIEELDSELELSNNHTDFEDNINDNKTNK
jgi:hypothetical protein